MVSRRLTCLTAAVVALIVSGMAWAQQPSLAEVARREAERRKNLKTSSKVYTDRDLKAGSRLTTAATTPQTPDASEPAPPPPQASVDQPPPADSAPAPDEPARDEEWWRQRVTDLQAALNRSRLFAEALQSRINGLSADFTARDDPAQRAVIEASRIEAIAELERVNSEIAGGETAIAELEEEARRAGVPPGWLR